MECLDQAPMAPMTMERVARGMAEVKEDACRVAIRRAKGAIFCHVDSNKKMCHCMGINTGGTHEWQGAPPSLKIIAAIKIMGENL